MSHMAAAARVATTIFLKPKIGEKKPPQKPRTTWITDTQVDRRSPLHADTFKDETDARIKEGGINDTIICPAPRVLADFADTIVDETIRYAPLSVGDATYEVVSRERMGGLGSIYFGVDLATQRAVVLKFPKLVSSIKVLEVEARTLALLNHPSVVGYLGHQDGCLVMEKVEGKDLEALLNIYGNLSVPKVIEIVMAAGYGLAHAAERNIRHGDIKPGNIMLTKKREVKIIDWGTASALEMLKGTGAYIYSKHYAPPEQMLGQEIDARADIYALGMTAYELMSGLTPTGREGVVPLVKELAPAREIPDSIFAILHKMAQPREEDRYQDWASVIAAFAEIAPDFGVEIPLADAA